MSEQEILTLEQIEQRLNLLTMVGEEPLEAQALETALALYAERARLVRMLRSWTVATGDYEKWSRLGELRIATLAALKEGS